MLFAFRMLTWDTNSVDAKEDQGSYCAIAIAFSRAAIVESDQYSVDYAIDKSMGR